MPTTPNYLLRAALALIGAVIVFLGLNVGLGGIQTLGWQGGDIGAITGADPIALAVRDSHIRFIGGVWLALGLLMLAGSLAFQHLRPILVALTFMVFIGALTRLTSAPAILFSPAVLPSLAFEALAMPLLGLWIHRAERPAVGS